MAEVIVPVSLIFFSVPVSSWASAGLGDKAERGDRRHYKLGVHRRPPAVQRLCLPVSF